MANDLIKALNGPIKHWYFPLIIGIILILTGIWTFTSPGESYLALSFIFSLSFLFSGLAEIVFSLASRKQMHNWGWTLAMGIFSTIIGIMLLSNPTLSMLTLPLYVGFMIMFRSFWAIGIAFDMKNYGVLEWGSLLAVGILGLVFSFFLIWKPEFAGMTLVFWTGLAFLASGIFNVYLSFKLKKIRNFEKEVGDKIAAH